MTDVYRDSSSSDNMPSANGYPRSSSSGNGYIPASELASTKPVNGTVPGIPAVVRKKLMGYVGFANLPNQVHRKSVRKGFQFTAMVVGEPQLDTSTIFHPWLMSDFLHRGIRSGQVDSCEHSF